MLLITPLYMRGILKWDKSVFAMISFILILLVFASFTQFALGGNEKDTIVISILGSAILLSWLGIKEVAGMSWSFAFIAVVSASIKNGSAMGLWGFVYITSGFLGLVLHSGLSPSELINGIKEEYSPSTKSIISTTKNDINSTVEKIT